MFRPNWLTSVGRNGCACATRFCGVDLVDVGVGLDVERDGQRSSCRRWRSWTACRACCRRRSSAARAASATDCSIVTASAPGVGRRDDDLRRDDRRELRDRQAAHRDEAADDRDDRDDDRDDRAVDEEAGHGLLAPDPRSRRGRASPARRRLGRDGPRTTTSPGLHLRALRRRRARPAARPFVDDPEAADALSGLDRADLDLVVRTDDRRPGSCPAARSPRAAARGARPGARTSTARTFAYWPGRRTLPGFGKMPIVVIVPVFTSTSRSASRSTCPFCGKTRAVGEDELGAPRCAWPDRAGAAGTPARSG